MALMQTLGISCSYIGTILAGLLLTVAGVFFIFIVLQLVRISQAPPNIPWVGLNHRKYFPKLRACLSELSAGRSLVNEGYEKYSKYNMPFVIPGMHWNGIVLPPSNNAWLAHQPESVLSGNKVLDDTLGLEYLTHGPSADSCRDFTVNRRDLTRQIVNLTPQILHEIASSLDDELGFEEEWKNVTLQSSIDAVAFRSANRIFVGMPQCRSERYKQAVMWWSFTYGCANLFLRYLVPGPMKWFLVPIVALPVKLTGWWAISQFKSKIQKRLKMRVGEKVADQENDMMQWIINENKKKRDPAELEPANIAGKMLLFNLFATATTSLILGTLIFHLLAHKDAASILRELKEEAERMMPTFDQDGRVLREMVKLDSVIRETLRCHPLGAQGMIREVVKPGGVETPDGIHLPTGTHVHSIVSSMQQDPAVHGESAAHFDPLRFHHLATVTEEENAGNPEMKREMAVQIREDYLSFGLGKHACPGRFFAVHVIKLVLAYLLKHYDMEPLEDKPKFHAFGEALIPSSKNTVRIRRRRLPFDQGDEVQCEGLLCSVSA